MAYNFFPENTYLLKYIAHDFLFSYSFLAAIFKTDRKKMIRNTISSGANTSSQPTFRWNNFIINRIQVNATARYIRIVSSPIVFFFFLFATNTWFNAYWNNISTRLFFIRPSFVSLELKGLSIPFPYALILPSLIPLETR